MSKPNLLIVDDIQINRTLLADIATSIGCTYTAAKNGKEALLELEKNDFDLILMDIEMPVMNGIETTDAIRKLGNAKSQTPVVALTAHNPEDFFTEFANTGFNELVTKPYLINKIQKLVETYCRKK